jgi:capsular polysaccharide transport system permease protein
MNPPTASFTAVVLALKRFFQEQKEILLAVILQDMKTRYGSSYLSYLVAILWPFSHMAVLIIAYMIINHYAPVGDDPFIFVATAVIPYMLCLYPSRLIAMSILINRPFLSYNVVSPQHLIFARVVLEFFNLTIVMLVVASICYALETNIVPLSLIDAATALFASISFGIALGFFFAVMVAVFGQVFLMLIILIMIVLYVGSFPFVPEYILASNSREYLSYNPIFCLIKWLRSAYYPSYQLDDIPKFYVVTLSIGFIFFGALSERFARGRIVGH